MLMNIAIGAFMIIVTTMIHAEGMVLVMRAVRVREAQRQSMDHRSRVYRIGGVVLIMFLVAVLEIAAWATLFIVLNSIDGIEQALYFSAVTFTTLGYGDIVLDERWRLLASFEAANGIIMFGWSTAIVIAAVQRVYIGERPASPGRND